MKKIIFMIILCNFIFLDVFTEELRKTDDTTVITRGMVSPTENEEARAAYDLGSKLLKENNFEEAEYYLLKAIELDPEFADAMDHLGLVYRNQKRYDEAENIYLKSIEIMPGNKVPYINLAIVYRFQDRLEDARQMYLKVIDIDEDDPESYYGIGSLYHLANQYENSIAFMNIAIEKYSQIRSMLIYDAILIQGHNFYAIDNYEEALKYYKIALRGDPENVGLKNRIEEIESE
jgi:tetratricopeptide (TPR) repeat protein